ncbi:hypothetical protein GE09DRAFT_1282307 [Coniochaeta sp. 2T2.1]|nr:hypothetical protein GE09DRAFT_1282307 [Coniochaeta sp. 2T2.1]
MAPVRFLRLAALVAILLALAGASLTTPEAGGITTTTRLSWMGTMTIVASAAPPASTSRHHRHQLFSEQATPLNLPHRSPFLFGRQAHTAVEFSHRDSSLAGHLASPSLRPGLTSPGPVCDHHHPADHHLRHRVYSGTPPSSPASPPPLTSASPPTGTTPPPRPGNGTNDTTPLTSDASSSSTNDSTAPIVVVSLVGIVVLVGLGTLLYVWVRTRRTAAPARAETPPAIELQPFPPSGAEHEAGGAADTSRVSWDDWFR